jgi:hypothetical protein
MYPAFNAIGDAILTTALAEKTQPAVRFGSRRIPVVLPSLRDPRLHLASVIMTVHVLGQTVLDFRVSIPQILVAILTAALIEVGLSFRRSGELVWPASAMLTGSGVALILRLVGAEANDYWSWAGWYIFAGVAATSLVSKYMLRWKGAHLFNPSNFGLVLAFLILGSNLIEPLDFWWGPFGLGLLVAYAVILGGGIAITRRLALLGIAGTFWLVLAGSLGLLASSGHCMTAAWALGPVCGFDFWWVIVTSPEVLIFLFFMITDPKTIPSGRGGRLWFGAAIAILGTVLIATQTTEFGAKVGLLSGLVLLTPIRGLFDRVHWKEWLAVGQDIRAPQLLWKGGLIGSGVGLMVLLIVVAGVPAREVAVAQVDAPPVEIDLSALPETSISSEVGRLNAEVAANPEKVSADLLRVLSTTAESLSRSDLALLRTVAGGSFLIAMEQKITDSATAGQVLDRDYRVDRVHIDVAHIAGPQGGASLAVTALGTLEEVVYDVGGGVIDSRIEDLETVFTMQPDADGSWMIVAESKT